MKALKLTILIFFLLASICNAQVIIKPENYLYTAYSGKTYLIPVHVINFENKKIEGYLNVFPSYIFGVSLYFPQAKIELNPNEEKIVNLIVFVPAQLERDYYSVKFEIYFAYDGKSSKSDLIITFLKEEKIILKHFYLDKNKVKPLETFKLELIFENVLNKQLDKHFLTISIEKEDKTYFSENFVLPSLSPKSQYKFVFEHFFPKNYLPGEYIIKVILKDLTDNKVLEFGMPINLLEEKNISVKRNAFSSLFSSKIQIIISNEGNTIENFSYTEKILSFMIYFTSFKYPYYNITYKDNYAFIDFFVYNLNPGETVTIEYEINYVLLVSTFSIVIIIILFILFYIQIPSIYKKSKFEKEYYKITIVAKNNYSKPIRNVEIVDIVPNIFNVFDFSVEPHKEKIKGATKLIWRFSKLNPKEEIILSYKLQPKIEVKEEIKFKQPKMTFLIGDKKKNARKAILIKK